MRRKAVREVEVTSAPYRIAHSPLPVRDVCATTEIGAALGALTRVRGGVWHHREINRENRYILQMSFVCSLRKNIVLIF